ncbi:MAG: preprotein translocase subunit SecE [Legionellales bacterium]|nr:preprotein translocase subunit SecE [Legionellales bacterium]
MKQLKKIEHKSTKVQWLDYFKWLVLSVVIIGYLVCNQIFREQSLVARLLVLIILLPIAFAIFSTTNMGKEFIEFAKLARIEFLKIVWPKQEESNKITLLVILAISVIAFVLWIFDAVFFLLIRQVTG